MNAQVKEKQVKLIVAKGKSVMVPPTEENRTGHLLPGTPFTIGEKEAKRLVADKFARLAAEKSEEEVEEETGSVSVQQNSDETSTVRRPATGAPSVSTIIR